MIELSESATRKLALGEDLNDDEVSDLFEYDYVKEGTSYPEFLGSGTSFYEAPGSLGIIHLIDVEREMFAYFSRHPDQMRLIPPRRFEELTCPVRHQDRARLLRIVLHVVCTYCSVYKCNGMKLREIIFQRRRRLLQAAWVQK